MLSCCVMQKKLMALVLISALSMVTSASVMADAGDALSKEVSAVVDSEMQELKTELRKELVESIKTDMECSLSSLSSIHVTQGEKLNIAAVKVDGRG